MLSVLLRKMPALIAILLGLAGTPALLDHLPWIGSPYHDYYYDPALEAALLCTFPLLTALGMLAWSPEALGKPFDWRLEFRLFLSWLTLWLFLIALYVLLMNRAEIKQSEIGLFAAYLASHAGLAAFFIVVARSVSLSALGLLKKRLALYGTLPAAVQAFGSVAIGATAAMLAIYLFASSILHVPFWRRPPSEDESDLMPTDVITGLTEGVSSIGMLVVLIALLSTIAVVSPRLNGRPVRSSPANA